MSGYTTTDLPTAPLADELIVNRNGNTAIQRVADLSTQLAGSGPLAEQLDDLRLLASGEPRQLLPADMATTAAIALTGAQTIDGIATGAGKRVLVKDQADAAQNGVWVTSAGAWTRATDLDAAAEFVSASIYVTAGTVNHATTWMQIASMVEVGTSAVTWRKIKDEAGLQALVDANTRSVEELVSAVTQKADISEQTLGHAGILVAGPDTLAAKTWLINDPADADSLMTDLVLELTADADVWVRRYTHDGSVTWTKSGTDLKLSGKAGTNTWGPGDIGTFRVAAGEYLAIYAGASIAADFSASDTIVRTVGSSSTGLYRTITGNASSGSLKPVGIRATLQAGQTVKSADGVGVDLTARRTMQVIGRSIEPIPSTTAAAARTAVDTTPAAARSLLTRVSAYLTGSAIVKIRRFTLSGSTLTQVGSDIVVTGVTGLNEWTPDDFGQVIVEAGEYIGFYTAGIIGYNTASTDTSGLTYWPTSTGDLTTITIGSTLNKPFEIRFELEQGPDIDLLLPLLKTVAALDALPASVAGVESALSYLTDTVLAQGLGVSYGDLIETASISYSASSANVDVAITVNRNGVSTETSYTLTVTLTGSGSLWRYDLVYLAKDGSLAIEAGAEARTTDASAFIPATPDEGIPLFMLRVGGTGVGDALSQWDLHDGIKRQIQPEVLRDIERNRRILARTRNKIARGDTINIQSLGDSITETAGIVGSNGVTTPNGQYRDRAASTDGEGGYQYLRTAYGDDVVDAVPLYTAVQLGRADDSAGAVHTRISYVWQLVAELERIGYTLGTDLTYDNFAQSGKGTTDLVDGSLLPRAWLDNAVALAPDVVIFAMGMNDLGGPEDVYARVRVIIREYQAAGTDVIVMGCARPRGDIVGNAFLSGWLPVNEALRRAAYDGGAAWVSLLPLYETRYLGALGMSVSDLCTANGYNHPGIREHLRMGDMLVQLSGLTT